MDIHKVMGKIPFKPKKGFVYLQLVSKDNPRPGNKPYNAADAISMLHDMCYRDNDRSAGKR